MTTVSDAVLRTREIVSINVFNYCAISAKMHL